MWFKYGLRASALSGRAAYLRNLNKVIKNHDSNRGMDGEMV